MNNLKRAAAALLSAFLLCTGPVPAAAPEDGTVTVPAEITEAPGSEELILSGSVPEDHAVGVPVDTEIHCIFPYSVTRDSRLKNNMNLLVLESIDGDYVPAEAYTPGNRPEEEKGRVLSLEPLEPLEPATTYVVRIGPGVKSRNGLRTVREQSFTFTTADENGKAVPARGPEEKDVFEELSHRESETGRKSRRRYRMTVSVMTICLAGAYPVYLLIKGRKKKDQ